MNKNDPVSLVQYFANNRTASVSAGRLAEGMLKQWGGVEGLCQEVYRTYDDALEGSMTRARIITAIVDLLKERARIDGEADSLGQYSPQDIAALAKELLLNGVPGVSVLPAPAGSDLSQPGVQADEAADSR